MDSFTKTCLQEKHTYIYIYIKPLLSLLQYISDLRGHNSIIHEFFHRNQSLSFTFLLHLSPAGLPKPSSSHKHINRTLYQSGRFTSWSIRLVPGAPSSIAVSIWKYHRDPDINQLAPRGGEGRAGGPKIINETDQHVLRLGQAVLIRAFPPVAAGTERRAASKFNTRHRSCELEAKKDTVERRYVPRLIIRAVSFSP